MPSKEETQMFRNDFIPLLKCCRALATGFRDPYLDKRNLELIEAYSGAFSKKYRTLRIVMEKGSYGLPKPAILLKDEDNFYSVFFVAESLIPRMQSVRIPYRQKYHTFTVQEFKARFSEFKPYLTEGDVFFEYSHEKAKRTVQLRYRKGHGMIQIVDDDFMFSEDDPEFLLCMHYAFDKGYDEAANLTNYSVLFIGRTQSEPEYYKGPTGGRGVF